MWYPSTDEGRDAEPGKQSKSSEHTVELEGRKESIRNGQAFVNQLNYFS